MIKRDIKTDLEIQRLKLFEAIDDGEFDEVRIIINDIRPHQRKNLLKSCNYNGMNCLHMACMKGAYELCDYLISAYQAHNISIVERDHRGYPTFMLAAIYGYTKKKRYKIELGEESYSRRYLIIKSFVNNGVNLSKIKRTNA